MGFLVDMVAYRTVSCPCEVLKKVIYYLYIYIYLQQAILEYDTIHQSYATTNPILRLDLCDITKCVAGLLVHDYRFLSSSQSVIIPREHDSINTEGVLFRNKFRINRFPSKLLY